MVDPHPMRSALVFFGAAGPLLAQTLSCSGGELYDRTQGKRVSSFNQLVEIEFGVPTIGAAP
jgi:hypothetical protein